MQGRTDALIRAAVRALEQNRQLIDSLPESLSSVQLDIKIGKENIPFSVHMAPRWSQSMALTTVGAPCDVGRYDFGV